MKSIALDKMTVKQLRELSERLSAAIVAREAQDLIELKQKMSALAKERGLSLADIIGSTRKVGRPKGKTKVKGKAKAKSASVVKYRDPANSDNTWTGRGRRPKWLNGVANVEKFRI